MVKAMPLKINRFVLFAVYWSGGAKPSPINRVRGTAPARIAGASKLWRVKNDY